MPASVFMDQDPLFTQACERLAERALQVNRDELLSFAELHALTKLSRHRIYRVVIRVNRDLLKAKRLLVNIRGQGYVVADTDLHMEHAHGRKLKAARQHMRGFRELQALETSTLTPDQQRQYLQQLSTLGVLAEMSRKHTVQGITLAAKSLYHQRESLKMQEDLATQVETMKQWFGNV